MKGCSRIFEYPTAEEQNSDATHNDNGVGFTGADAFILSRFAKSIDEGKFVGSPKQMAILFKKMHKYARQLDGIAQAKLAKAEPKQVRGSLTERNKNQKWPTPTLNGCGGKPLWLTRIAPDLLRPMA